MKTISMYPTVKVEKEFFEKSIEENTLFCIYNDDFILESLKASKFDSSIIEMVMTELHNAMLYIDIIRVEIKRTDNYKTHIMEYVEESIYIPGITINFSYKTKLVNDDKFYEVEWLGLDVNLRRTIF